MSAEPEGDVLVADAAGLVWAKCPNGLWGALGGGELDRLWASLVADFGPLAVYRREDA